MTLAQLRKTIANDVESYVEGTIKDWYAVHEDVGEPKFTLGMTQAMLDMICAAYDVADHIDHDLSYREDVANAVLPLLWKRYIGLTVGEHDSAWGDLRDIIDSTYEILVANTIAGLLGVCDNPGA